MLIKKNSFLFQESFFYIILPKFLLIFLPLLLITGSFLPDLAVTLSSIIFIINSFKNNLIKFYKNNFFYIFLIFYFILILSSIFSNYPSKSLPTSLSYLRFGVFALSTWYLISLNEKIINYLLYSLSAAFCILIIDGYFQFFFGSNLLGWPIIGTRISSFFGDKLVLGSYLSRLLPIFFGCIIYILKKQANNHILFFGILIFILSDVLIFLSGERAALFFANLSVLILIFLLDSYKKIRIISFLISIFLIILISILQPKFKERVYNDTLNQLNLVKSLNFSFETTRDSAYFFTIEHDFLFKSAVAIFLDNKIIGVGPKLFRVECFNQKYFKAIWSCSTHPHNTYIQLLSETGIAGFSIVFFTFLICCFYFIKHFFVKIIKKKLIFNDFELCIITAIFISLWPIITTGNFFGNWINVIYYFPVGLLLFSLNKKF